MAIRSRAIRPDTVLETSDGRVIECVSDEAFVRGVVDAATAITLVGGEMRVVVQRQATEFANEAVTTAALIEWRNHTEAKPQPEPHVGPREMATYEESEAVRDAFDDEADARADETAPDDVTAAA